MFKALLIHGTPLTIDYEYYDQWLVDLAQIIIDCNGYRVYHTRDNRNDPKKKRIQIVDPHQESKAYEWLTYYAGYREYAHLMMNSNAYMEWLIPTCLTLGIKSRGDRDTFSECVIEYLLKEPWLKDRLLQHDNQLESVKNKDELDRVRKIIESLLKQAEEIGIDLMFFVDNKFNLYYVLGDLYKVKATKNDATLKDHKDLVGKDFVDFS